jgi:hypothetical protein
MYDKSGKLLDRREMLKIKIKSLAAEARIIRREERKTTGRLREEMYQHRIGIVRQVTRNTLIAYGLIRGQTIEQMEPNRKSDPDWDAIDKMLKKYGPAQKIEYRKAA